MANNYPGATDSFTPKTDDVDDVLAQDVNELQTGIVAIETELGTDPAGSVADVKTRLAESLDDAGKLRLSDNSTVTISSGTITVTKNMHSVDTEASAASDDIDIINGGSATGQPLILHPVNDARTVVIKHNTGNVKCVNDDDLTLDDIHDFAILIWDNANSYWYAAQGSSGDLENMVTGSGVAQQVTFWDTTSSVTGSTYFTYDPSTRTLTTDNIQFALSPLSSAAAEGELKWNADDGVLQVGLPGGNVILQIGQEILIKVKAAEDISNGEVVYISGASGSRPEASLANADSSDTSRGTIALATEDINSGQNGYVTAFGLVRDVDTDGIAEGAELFLDTTDGQYTDTAPGAPHFVTRVGYVLRAHATEGVILVNIQVTPGARKINTHRMDGATYSRLQDYIDQTSSAGWIEGGDFSDNGDGTITVATGSGLIRETNDSNGNLVFFDWAEDDDVSLTDNQANYISVDYNSGSPQIISGTTNTANGQTIFNLGLVFREGTDVHFFRAGQVINDPMKKIIQRFNAEGMITLTSGGTVAETGARYLTVSAATLYGGITKFDADAIDTSGTDTFEYYYTDGLGGWQYVSTTATQINNTQYDNGGTLTALTNNRCSSNKPANKHTATRAILLNVVS